MKRKILQICPTIEFTYAVADDGTWWRILDPLVNDWVQLRDLPERDASFAEETHSEAIKPLKRLAPK